MKLFLFYITVLPALFSCTNNPDPADTVSSQDSVVVKQNFFPVTSYIRGQVFEMKKTGINPLKYTITGNHTDSVWLKIEDINEAVKEFLTPEIDSANLVDLFTEKNFLDQTIGAFTFTYEPINKLPDTMKLKRWDVHIDPETQKVKRIYLVKEVDKSKTLQLIWQSNKYCKITTIITDKNGNSSVEKEEKITWDLN